MNTIRICFVCLGNICRSPMAEGLFKSLVANEGMSQQFEIDSAGTSNYHPGKPPDPRGASQASLNGVILEGKARQLLTADLESFDYILVMDQQNLTDVLGLDSTASHGAKIQLLRDFDPLSPPNSEVQDPYYGGQDEYQQAWVDIDAACRALLAHIRATLQLAD